MPKQRPKRKAAEIAAQQIYNQRLYTHGGPQRHCIRRPLTTTDEEVRQLNSLANMTYSQMTPVGQGIPSHLHPSLQHIYPGSGYSSGYIPLTSLPYSPMGSIPGSSFAPSPMIIPMAPESPQKSNVYKKISRKEFEAQVARRLEDKIEHVLGKVDPGLEIIQREIQVKERLRLAVAKRQLASSTPVGVGGSPSGVSASIFYTPSTSPTPTSRNGTPVGSAFTPIRPDPQIHSITSTFLESAQQEMASLNLTPMAHQKPIEAAYSNILLGGVSSLPFPYGQLPHQAAQAHHYHLPTAHQLFYTGSVPPY